MTENKNPDVHQLFSRLVQAVAETLKPHGYKRQGQVFRALANGNCGIIGFQRSVTDTRDAIRFTMNLGIVCGDLCDLAATPLEKSQIADAHVSRRVGFLLPERQDKWWEVNTSTDCHQLSQEISNLISNMAVPYINQFMDTKAIYSLWESGQSPGLTEFQRARYLARLKSKLMG